MRAALIVACLLAVPARDLIPPGHTDVRHELVLVWDAAALPYSFVASPTHGFHGNIRIRAGEPFRFSTKYGTRIHAAPPDAQLPAAKERVANEPWPAAPVPVREVRSIATGHPLARVETTLRIVRVAGDTIVFERVGERRLDRAGNELGDLDWLPLAVIAAIGAAWTWRLGRTRHARPGSTP